MSYDLTVEEKGTYLHLRVTGENTVENLTGYLEEGLRKSTELGRAYVLVEEFLTGPELDMEVVWGVVERVGGPAAQILRAVAFVNVNPEHDQSLTRFAENLATNLNVNMRAFRRIDDAERWLRFESTGEA